MTVHTHDVSACFNAALTEECRKRLEETLSDEVTIGDECLEFFDKFVVKL
jgi:hypothetical protein